MGGTPTNVAVLTETDLGPFWTFPGELLSGRSAACGFAFINSVGNLGAYFGLSAIGSIATKTGSFSGGFRVVSAALVCAATLILALKLHRRRRRASGNALREAG
jgi:ACS family tartrate transporter-like MFS transporter